MVFATNGNGHTGLRHRLNRRPRTQEGTAQALILNQNQNQQSRVCINVFTIKLIKSDKDLG